MATPNNLGRHLFVVTGLPNRGLLSCPACRELEKPQFCIVAVRVGAIASGLGWSHYY